MTTIWIFGYGSLLWRPDFPFVDKRPATVTGLARRFEQGSPDHRGTPERLGRVVTLVYAPEARVDGMVYALPPESAEAILEQIDRREQGGYDRVRVSAALRGEDRTVEAITWIAPPGNPYHLGPAPLEAMIDDIITACGPSGTNLEYVLKLAETLRALGFEDDYVFEMALAAQKARGGGPPIGPLS